MRDFGIFSLKWESCYKVTRFPSQRSGFYVWERMVHVFYTDSVGYKFWFLTIFYALSLIQDIWGFLSSIVGFLSYHDEYYSYYFCHLYFIYRYFHVFIHRVYVVVCILFAFHLFFLLFIYPSIVFELMDWLIVWTYDIIYFMFWIFAVLCIWVSSLYLR